MEPIAKILITVFIVFTAAKALHWTWTSHIDPIATIQKLYRQKPKIADLVITRDPNKLYQSEVIVANVTGSVDVKNGTVIFEQITDTSRLDKSKPIEYRRFKLRIMHVGRIIGVKSVVSEKGSKVLQNVMEDVICEKVE